MARQRSRSKGFKGGIFVLFLGAVVLYLGSLSSQPDYEIRFVREVPSSLTTAQLDEAFRTLEQWRKWHVVTKAVEVDAGDTEQNSAAENPAPSIASDSSSATDTGKSAESENESQPPPLTPVRAGLPIRYFIESPKKQWKRFEIRARVLEYIPQKRVHVKFVEDSNHKISQLFEHLEWTVELIPQETSSSAQTGAQPKEQLESQLANSSPQQTTPKTVIRGTLVGTTRNWRSRLFGSLARRILMNQVFYPELKALARFNQPFSKPASGLLKE